MFLKHGAQRGFTLIELIILIVAIGILSAIAVPKYMDASKDAKLGALKGAADALTGAAAQNYALEASGTTNFRTLTSCADVLNLATMPAEMTLSQIAAPGPGVLGTCEINYGSSYGPLSTGYRFKLMGA